MKESLACNQCPKIICADTGDGKRVISETGTDNFVVFPEPVIDCPRRTKGGVYGETEWHVPDGRPDLTMPVK